MSSERAGLKMGKESVYSALTGSAWKRQYTQQVRSQLCGFPGRQRCRTGAHAQVRGLLSKVSFLLPLSKVSFLLPPWDPGLEFGASDLQANHFCPLSHLSDTAH